LLQGFEGKARRADRRSACHEVVALTPNVL
jgi:hypothetical protein